MTTINNIDPTKPLEFAGYRNDGVCANPVDGLPPIELDVTETGHLLAYLLDCCWRADFDWNLQCISETEVGEPLLTGWMSIAEFNSFTEYATGGTPEQQAVITKLHNLTIDWEAKGVEDVYFDGYRKEPQCYTAVVTFQGSPEYEVTLRIGRFRDKKDADFCGERISLGFHSGKLMYDVAQTDLEEYVRPDEISVRRMRDSARKKFAAFQTSTCSYVKPENALVVAALAGVLVEEDFELVHIQPQDFSRTPGLDGTFTRICHEIEVAK